MHPRSATDMGARFILGVRSIDTAGRHFEGTGCDGRLQSHDQWLEECFERSEGMPNTAWLPRAWRTCGICPRTALDVTAHLARRCRAPTWSGTRRRVGVRAGRRCLVWYCGPYQRHDELTEPADA